MAAYTPVLQRLMTLGAGKAGHTASKQFRVGSERHSFRVRVTPTGGEVTIQVDVDDDPFVAWTGRPSKLSVYHSLDVPQSNTVGLFVAPDTAVLWHELSLTLLDGTAQLYLPSVE